MKIVSSKEVYSCRSVSGHGDEAADRTGWKIERSDGAASGSAVMMAVDDKDRILLVRQYRLPADNSCGNCRRARSMRGNGAQAAKRELSKRRAAREEVEEADVVLSQPGLRRGEDDHLPCDRTDAGEAQPMEDERIETRWFTKKELREGIGRTNYRREDDDRIPVLGADVAK